MNAEAALEGIARNRSFRIPRLAVIVLLLLLTCATASISQKVSEPANSTVTEAHLRRRPAHSSIRAKVRLLTRLPRSNHRGSHYLQSHCRPNQLFDAAGSDNSGLATSSSR